MARLSDQIKDLWKQKRFADLQAIANSRLQANSNDVMGLVISLDLYPITGTNYADLVSLNSRLEAHAQTETNQIFQRWYNFFKMGHQELLAEFGSADTNRQNAIRLDIMDYVGPPPSFLLADQLGL
jgi:hypothetical protein